MTCKTCTPEIREFDSADLLWTPPVEKTRRPPRKFRPLSYPDPISEVVSKHFAVTVADMQSNTRKREVVNARFIAMYLMRIHTDLSFKKVGQFFGNRHHTSVIFAFQTVKDIMSVEDEYAHAVELLSQRVHKLRRPGTENKFVKQDEIKVA